MIKAYRKTVTIKAEQFDGSGEIIKKYSITPPMPLDPDYTINTIEGDMVLGVGDWIATGINGEHWAIADDVFKKTYAELPVIPDYVAEYIDMAKNNKTRLNNPNIAEAIVDVVEYGGGNVELAAYIEENGDTFARAWLDGYQVEEDK
ncbi:DUF1642 domain-containing protein [Lactiplantibacillus plantarum]